MGTPNVNKENILQRPSGSGSANIGNINHTKDKPGSIFYNDRPFNTSARISPSNYNMGKGLTVPPDQRSQDALNLCFGGNSSKYYNTGYNLRELYPTNSLANSYQNQQSGWDKFLGGMGKALSIGMGAVMGYGLVSSVISLFGGKKSEKASEEGSDNETTVNVKDKSSSDTVNVSNSNNLDNMDIQALTTYKGDNESSIEKMKEDYAQIDTNIATLTSQIAEKNAKLPDAKRNSDEKQKAAGEQQTKLNDARDAVKDNENAVNKIKDDLSNINAKIVGKEAQMQQMKAAGQDTTAIMAEINELKAKERTTKKALEIANQNLTKANADFKTAGKESERLNKEAAGAKKEYEDLKNEIKKDKQAIETLEKNRKELPKKIGDCQANVTLAELKIKEKENSTDEE